MKTGNNDLLSKINSFFESHEKSFLWISLFAGAFISFLMFDTKVSLSGDDCDYLINAQNFIEHFTYPNGRGALYPIVISPLLLGGLNLIFTKAFSAVFILLSMWLMYKSFRGIIPAIILMPTLLIVNICSYIYFYASYTYSEPFFMLSQSIFIYLFIKYFYNKEQEPSLSLKTDWRKYLLVGLSILAMGLTRTIGFGAIGAAILYFCFKKEWKNLLYTTSSLVIIFLLFSIFKNLVWPESGASYDINNYLAKNFYNVELGMEDFPGYIDRLVVNSNIYLSGFFYQYLGIIPPSEAPNAGWSALSIFTYILFFVCLVILFKKNKPLFFAGLYVGVMNFISFILLQTIWAQDRLIMIYYPLMLLFILGGFYYLIKDKFSKSLYWVFPVILIALFIGTSIHSKAKIGNNLPVLQQNILGNDLYGLTADWENFIKMSRWANDNLDKDAVIASRKPSISYVYTGRNFHGIFSVPKINIDEVINKKREIEEEGKYTYLIVELTPESYILDSMDPYIQYLFVCGGEKTMVLNNKNVYYTFVFKIEKSTNTDALITFLDANNLSYSFDYNAFFDQFVNDKSFQYQIMDPDILINHLVDNNIRYLILAKLRVYTSQNTGQYINTLQQYISFIQFKYPGRFNMIHTIGKEENCELAEFLGK